MKKTLIVPAAAIFLHLLITGAAAQETRNPQLTLYGFIRFETIYDNTEIAKGDWHLFARPGDSDYADRSIFTMNARHSRLGMKLASRPVSGDASVTGLVEVDFAGGFPNSSTAARQPLLRLRHAWVEIGAPGWALRLGQDWALISGPFPNTTSFVVGAGKGNLWMRVPQIRYTVDKGHTAFAISLNRPMAGNIQYNDFTEGDFDPVGDGERSGYPWLMSRFWLRSRGSSFSLSGHYGREEIADLSGTVHTMNTYSLNADAVVALNPVTVTLRAFTGENLNTFFGGVFQGFSRDSLNVTNVSSTGGWGQITCAMTDKWMITAGAGIDDPDNSDIAAGGRTKNEWIFANLSYAFSPAVQFMLEGDYLKTRWKAEEPGKNLRVQFVTCYRF